jgi:hypothetical protein
MDEKLYGLRRRDIRVLAYQIAVKNNIQHTFSRGKGMAGKKWLNNFIRPHPHLAFRTPHLISLVRVKSFTEENVEFFFDLLKSELQKVKSDLTKVYNVNEAEIFIV